MVLTAKEYEEKNRLGVTAQPVVKTKESILLAEDKKPRVKYLFHIPEFTTSEKLSYDYIVGNNKRKVINNVIMVDSEAECEILKKSGFLFLKEI